MSAALRVVDNAPVRDGWRLVRFELPARGQGLAPGQWLRLRTGEGEAAVPVYRSHTGEGWWAALLPPGHRLAGVTLGRHCEHVDTAGAALATPDARTVLLGAGVGVGPILAVCEAAGAAARFVCLGDASGLPVRLVPSRYVVPSLPPDAMAGAAPLEAAGIASRAAVPGERPGCFDGDAVELLRRYVSAIPAAERGTLRLVAATPWRALARWHAELAGLFAGVDLLELPEVSDARPRRGC